MQAGSGSPPPENKKDIGSWGALHECAQELRRSDWPNVWAQALILAGIAAARERVWVTNWTTDSWSRMTLWHILMMAPRMLRHSDRAVRSVHLLRKWSKRTQHHRRNASAVSERRCNAKRYVRSGFETTSARVFDRSLTVPVLCMSASCSRPFRNRPRSTSRQQQRCRWLSSRLTSKQTICAHSNAKRFPNSVIWSYMNLVCQRPVSWRHSCSNLPAHSNICPRSSKHVRMHEVDLHRRGHESVTKCTASMPS